MVLHLTESTAFTSKAGYELERTQTTTEGGPLAALPLVSLYLYIPDCPPCVQMFQLKVVDLATWRAHGLLHRSLKLKPEGILHRLMRVHRVWLSLGVRVAQMRTANGHAYAVGEGDAFIHKHRWTGTM